MNILPEQSHDANLYSMLCDYFYWKTHPDAEEDGQWHRDDQGEAFADRIFECIKKELEQ